MADLVINVKDEASARAWLEKVLVTNDEYQEAMREAGETLQSAKDFGEGTMVDEFYDLGTNLMGAATKVFTAINEISSTVNTVLSSIGSLSSTVSTAINVVKGIFG